MVATTVEANTWSPVFVPVIASSLVLSAADMLPGTEPVAATIEMAGVAPPEETIGAVPEIEATAALDETESNFVLSAAERLPAKDVVAALMLMAGVVPPEDTIGAVPDTVVTAAAKRESFPAAA